MDHLGISHCSTVVACSGCCTMQHDAQSAALLILCSSAQKKECKSRCNKVQQKMLKSENIINLGRKHCLYKNRKNMMMVTCSSYKIRNFQRQSIIIHTINYLHQSTICIRIYKKTKLRPHGSIKHLMIFFQS